MSVTVTSLYGALLGLLFFALSLRTLRLRRRLRIAVGDGGHPRMLRAMRVHANFAEYVPIALLLLILLELQGTSALLLHPLGLCLLGGRLAHAGGVAREPEDYRYRIAGMGLTFTALLGSAFLLLLTACTRLLG